MSAARDQGVRTFTAEVLTENSAMLKVFADAGLQARRSWADGLAELAFDLPGSVADAGWEPYLDAVASREGHADVASLRHLFAAESVAVIGASRNPQAVGRAILHNIVTGGYTGRVYPVNPLARNSKASPACPRRRRCPRRWIWPWSRSRPEAVLDVAEECGQRGVKSLVVITAGLDAAAKADLLACCRRHGMRLIGPNCFGIAVPGLGLDATFGASHPAAGQAGLAVQSGGLGIALGRQLSRLGIGISSFASLGDKCDVSGNDLLMWWEQDPATKHGRAVSGVVRQPAQVQPDRPPRGSRPCRSSPCTPGRSQAGQRAASHTAAAATPLVTREALFEQAGIIATQDIGELLETAACWPASRCPAAAGWRSCPTPAAPACWPRTPAPTRACTSLRSAARYRRRSAAGCPPAPRSPARSTPPRRSRPETSAAAWN